MDFDFERALRDKIGPDNEGFDWALASSQDFLQEIDLLRQGASEGRPDRVRVERLLEFLKLQKSIDRATAALLATAIEALDALLATGLFHK